MAVLGSASHLVESRSPKYWSKVLFSTTMYNTCLMGELSPTGGQSTCDLAMPASGRHGSIENRSNLSLRLTWLDHRLAVAAGAGSEMALTVPLAVGSPLKKTLPLAPGPGPTPLALATHNL